MWLNKIKALALHYFTKEGREGRRKEGRREGGASKLPE